MAAQSSLGIGSSGCKKSFYHLLSLLLCAAQQWYLVDGFFGLGSNFFFHGAVMFDLFEDELVFLEGNVYVFDGL